LLSNNGGALRETSISRQGIAGETRRRWFAAYTRSRHEKRIADQCQGLGIGHFLPLYRSHRKWKNRVTVDLSLPLFPNYIFVQLFPGDHIPLLKLPGVLSMVGNATGSVPIPEGDMDALQQFVRCKTVVPHAPVHVGDAVRINRGPLNGLTGFVVRKNNGVHFVVTLDLIGKSVAVDLNGTDLESLDPESLRA
jgi:transcription termination/antitermination protein NusG